MSKQIILKIEWDDNKNKINKTKHGVSFEDASFVFNDENALTIYDKEHSAVEERFITLGMSIHNILLVIHTYVLEKQKEKIRIISARKANRKEQQQYFNRIKENKL